MITYVDEYNRQSDTERLLKVKLNNGKEGVALIGYALDITSFDFEKNILEKNSIAGTLNLRDDIDEGVQSYNAHIVDSGSDQGLLIEQYEEMGVQPDA